MFAGSIIRIWNLNERYSMMSRSPLLSTESENTSVTRRDWFSWRDFNSDCQVATVSFFTKFIGHCLMESGIAAPGERFIVILKDTPWLILAVSVSASLVNTNLVVGPAFHKPESERSFDIGQMTLKFVFGVIGFSLSYSPTQDIVLGSAGMALGLFLSQITINRYNTHRQHQQQSQDLPNQRDGSWKNDLIDACSIILKGAVEGAIWAALEKYPFEEYESVQAFFAHDSKRMLLFSCTYVAALTSAGFVIGGRLNGLLRQLPHGLQACGNGLLNCIGSLWSWRQAASVNESDEESRTILTAGSSLQ